MCDKPPKRTFHETKPAAHTFYFEISLGGGLPHETGVFFPDKFQPGPKVDLIIYLGGTDQTGTLRDYWDPKGTYTLRERVNDSQTSSFLLVAPTVSVQGEPGAQFTTVGQLAQHPESYLKQLMCAISNEEPYDKKWKDNHPTPGKIIVAGHSGGGFDLPHLALAIKASGVGHLCECWGFDCLYFENLDDWVALARSGVPLWLYDLKKRHQEKSGQVWYDYDGTTAQHALALEKKIEAAPVLRTSPADPKRAGGATEPQKSLVTLPHVTFVEISAQIGEHYRIPANHLKERIQNATCDQ
jgi:hypothetical protein